MIAAVFLALWAVGVAVIWPEGATEQVVLLPSESGSSSGALVVLDTEGNEQARLDSPYRTAYLGDGVVETAEGDSAAVDQQFGTLIGDLPPPPRTFVLYYLEGTTTLTPESQPVLQTLLTEVIDRPGAQVQVTGHTDTVGSTADNDQLSRDRATSVREELIGIGIEQDMIIAVGRGERELLVPTEDNVRDPSNRRVEITVR